MIHFSENDQVISLCPNTAWDLAGMAGATHLTAAASWARPALVLRNAA